MQLIMSVRDVPLLLSYYGYSVLNYSGILLYNSHMWTKI